MFRTLLVRRLWSLVLADIDIEKGVSYIEMELLCAFLGLGTIKQGLGNPLGTMLVD
jgi:hypothetical protein